MVYLWKKRSFGYLVNVFFGMHVLATFLCTGHGLNRLRFLRSRMKVSTRFQVEVRICSHHKAGEHTEVQARVRVV